MSDSRTVPFRSTGGLIVSLILIVVGAVAFSPQAWAHDSVVSSSPEDGSTVSEFPHDIQLTMSGNPRDNFNTVAVSNKSSGKVIAKGTPTISGNVISFTVPEDADTSPGTYTVGFQITSSDGHSTRGSISFTYSGDSHKEESAGQPASEGNSEDNTGESAGSSVSSENSNDGSSQDTDSSSSTSASSFGSKTLWLSIAVIIVIIGALVVALRRLRDSSSDDRDSR
ncbi:MULTISPECIES: copper resistance protein CopC [Corynebacterium]|nr:MULTISPECIES: copper resistance protein CopC [Corynebacterium]MDN8623543.1 copper resistance protein CopC [Corynebacterium kroppenstedtii]QRQ64582.1 copper resistance protein CopC [Corynebacterium kroppenstedtii]